MMETRLKTFPGLAAFLLLPLFAAQSPAYGSNPSHCPELLSRAAVAAQVRHASRLTEEKIQAALKSPYYQALSRQGFSELQNSLFGQPEVAASFRRAFEAGRNSRDFYIKLGFEFLPDGTMRAPDEGVILLRLELMIDEAIHEGTIDPSRFLMPAKIFKNASGNLIIFSPMRLAELTESDLSELTPLDGKIGSNEIHKTVQRGNWPLSSIEVTTFNGGRTTMLMHDLAHFEGFLRYPEYASAFRNVFERVSHELALNQTGLSRSIGYLTEEFTEFASLLMPDASPVLESILEGLPRLEDVGIDGSVQSLIDARARALEQRSSEEIHRLHARLAAAHVEDWERPVGGNQLDPINNEWHATRLRSRLGSWPITTFLDPTSEPLSRITSTQDLAKFLTAMEALEHLEPEDYLGLLASGSRAFDLSARHPREKWLTQYFLAAYHHDAGEIRVSILLATPRAVREVIDAFLSGRQSNMSRLQIRIANESVLLGGGPMLTYLTRRKMELESSPSPRLSEVEKALQFIDRAIVSCSNKLDSRDPRLVRLQPVLNGPADTATRLAALEREFPIPTAPQ